MNNRKEAGITSNVSKSLLRVLEEGGEAAAKGSAKNVIKDITKNIGEDITKGYLRNDFRKILSAIPKNIFEALSKSNYKNIITFFTISDDKTLNLLLGDGVIKQMDDIIAKSIIKAAPKIEKEVIKEIIQEVGGGRQFLKNYMGKGTSFNVKSLDKITSSLSKDGMNNIILEVDSGLNVFFKSNPQVFKRITTESMGKNFSRMLTNSAIYGVGISNLYSGLISLYDYLFERTDNVNKSIMNVISNLKDIITEGATTKAQTPQLISDIRKATVQLINLNKDLMKVSINSKIEKVKDKEQIPQFNSFYKKQLETKLPEVKETVENIEFVFNIIIPLMNDYDSHWTEYITALGIGASANRAKQVLISIEKAQSILQIFVIEFEQAKDKIESISNTEPTKVSNSTQKLILVAQEMEKKNPTSDDLYSELTQKEVKEKEPGEITKVIQKAVAPIVLTFIPKSIASSPTRFNALLSMIDAAFIKTNSILTSKVVNFLASKGVPAAMNTIGMGVSSVASKGALAAGWATGGVLAGISGLDIGHSLGKLIFGGGGTLGGEISQLLNYLEQADGGIKDTEWSKLNRKLQTKLAGSSYIIEKGIKDLQNNKIVGTKITEENIKNFTNSLNGMSQVSQGIKNILEVTNILKQKQTRDLYIKHGESVAGAIARGADAVINFVSTFGGIFGDRTVGENSEGFLNIFNGMMDFVKEIEALILKVQEEILPYYNNIKKIKDVLTEIQPLIADAAKEIKEGKI